MPRRRSVALALIGASWVSLCPSMAVPGDAASATPSLVACSPDRVAVTAGGTVLLRAWADLGKGSDGGRSVRYEWDAPVGRLDGRGAEVRWVLAGVRAGRYAAAVRLHNHRGPLTDECIVRVVVTAAVAERGGSGGLAGITAPTPHPPPAATRPRETGSAFLSPNQAEAPGYGLYSYLLFGTPPGDGGRERYTSALEAYLGLVPDIAALAQYVPASELNIAYIPVRAAPDREPTRDRILADYDYARARSLLRLFPGAHRDGPYIVSSLAPLGAAGQSAVSPTPYLFQDLSNVPPHLIASWVKEFLNQAAQERFWEDRSAERFALKLRMTVGILATALPEVKKALDTWIAWVR